MNLSENDGNIKNLLATRKFAHLETLRKHFDESKISKGPYIWYQTYGGVLYMNTPKHLAC